MLRVMKVIRIIKLLSYRFFYKIRYAHVYKLIQLKSLPNIEKLEQMTQLVLDTKVNQLLQDHKQIPFDCIDIFKIYEKNPSKNVTELYKSIITVAESLNVTKSDINNSVYYMLGVLNRFYKTQISDADYEIQEEQHNLNFNVVDIDNAIAQNLNTIKDLQNKIKALTLEKTELILKGNRKRVKLLKYKEMLDILYNTYEKELKGISDDCNLYWK